MFKWLKILLIADGLLWAKGDQENTMAAINKQRTTTQNNTTGYQTANNNRIGSVGSIDPNTGVTTPGSGLMNQQQNQLNEATNNYRNFAGTGGVSQSTTNALSPNGPNSIAGNIKQPNYDNLSQDYQNIAATGGIDPTQTNNAINGLGSVDYSQSTDASSKLGNMNPLGDISGVTKGLQNIDYSGVNNSVGNLNNFASTGGVTAQDLSNLNRPLFYENEQTGGYSPTDIANIKKESNAPISSFYSSLQDEMNRQKAASGYGPGFSDAAQAATRQGAVAAGNQDLQTNIGLAESIRQGKMDAAKQLAANQLGLTQATTGAKEAALSSAGNLGLGITGQEGSNLAATGGLINSANNIRAGALGSAGSLANSKNANQIGALSDSGNLSANLQKILQSGKLAGLGGMMDANNATATNSLNQGKLASSNASTLGGMQQQGQEFGTSGLSSLYNSTTGQISQALAQQLSALGLDANEQQQLLALLSQEGTQPGSTATAFGNVFKGIGAGAGALSGLGGLFSGGGGGFDLNSGG